MNQPAKGNLMRKLSVKVKYLDENDNVVIEFFDSMDSAYKKLESVRLAYGGEYFPCVLTVTPYPRGFQHD
jgi:hypothetical protein